MKMSGVNLRYFTPSAANTTVTAASHGAIVRARHSISTEQTARYRKNAR